MIVFSVLIIALCDFICCWFCLKRIIFFSVITMEMIQSKVNFNEMMMVHELYSICALYSI